MPIRKARIEGGILGLVLVKEVSPQSLYHLVQKHFPFVNNFLLYFLPPIQESGYKASCKVFKIAQKEPIIHIYMQ